LKQELILVADTLKQITYESFVKINPNAYSKLYVNPVVWGKTLALLNTPFQAAWVPGPAGPAFPPFLLLDIFFGRPSYTTTIGQEATLVRRWFPKHWQDFLAAVEQISVADYVLRSGDATLSGMFQEAKDAYSGETGLLGRHRLKTYGFLDLSFKTGRRKTLGSLGGAADRPWDTLNTELDLARLERYSRYPQAYHHVRVKRLTSPASMNRREWGGWCWMSATPTFATGQAIAARSCPKTATSWSNGR
jgi:hypothetical protein